MEEQEGEVKKFFLKSKTIVTNTLVAIFASISLIADEYNDIIKESFGPKVFISLLVIIALANIFLRFKTTNAVSTKAEKKQEKN